MKGGAEDVVIVRDFSLELRWGEAAGLVGPSGCGKTVLCTSLLGMLEPPLFIKSGSIVYTAAEGRSLDLAVLPEKAWRPLRGKEISMIFQNPQASLNPSRTIQSQFIEVIRAHRAGLDKKTAAGMARDALARCMLPDPGRVLKSYPFELSGGMAQRAVIAMALIHDPALLIADEPTTALDRKNEDGILDLFASIRAEGRTALLFVSHDEWVTGAVTNRQIRLG